jgi:hypothetical protein
MSRHKVLLRNFLIRAGYHLSRGSDSNELHSLIQRLQPVSIDRELIRLGGSGDGGYLVPDDLDNIDACFSPGVANVAEFEADLASRGIRSFMADYSVSSPPTDNKLFTFDKMYLGAQNTDRLVRLEDWLASHSISESSDLILQMDIEGAEYSILLDTPREVLNRFRIIVVEFHGLDMLFVKESFGIIRQVFEKVLQDFSVVHIHPNNKADILKKNGMEVPLAMEFTFYRNDRIGRSRASLHYPHRYDSPNDPGRPEVALPACWWK